MSQQPTTTVQPAAQATEAVPEGYLPPLPPEDWPNIDHLMTEDGAAVDSIFSERQQRMLVESLYTAWSTRPANRPFLAFSNVGLFYTISSQAIVPDVLVSQDVELFMDTNNKYGQSYFIWHYGKPPDLVIEVVSNKVGDELTRKLETYEHIHVSYYAIFDAEHRIMDEPLRLYELRGRSYVRQPPGATYWLEQIGLGLTLWEGTYEGATARWLRWCNQAGTLLPIAAEAIAHEQQRAEAERQRAAQAEAHAEAERQRTAQAEARAEQLAARLRELGIDPGDAAPPDWCHR